VAAVVETDLLVIGAGPTGLFATYYAGFRGFDVTVVDSLPELGGQVTAMYPEKAILDVAGFPSVKGRDLVDGLVEQAATADPHYLLDRSALRLEHDGETVVVGLDDDTTVRAKAVLVTAGIGKFAPRPLPAGEGWLGRGMEFFVPSFAPYADKDVVIVGGGDSAFDWALNLLPIARSVTMCHRRGEFRAHDHTVAQVLDSPVRVLPYTEVARIHGEDDVTGVEVFDNRTDERTHLPVQAVIAALGFKADIGPLKRWGLRQERRSILVDSTMATNLPRVFAAGDIVEYQGKVKLISVGFGEAAIAVNNAAPVIDPSAKLFPVARASRHIAMYDPRTKKYTHKIA
jgi:ferredoxin/flavodoxin---NADP+ reductase